MTEAEFEDVIFSDLGDSGLLCEYAQGPLDIERQRRIWAVCASLRGMQGVQEIVPGMNNLAVLFDLELCVVEDLMARIRDLWRAPTVGTETGREITIPVVYGGDQGPDLNALAKRAGLDPAEFAAQHAQAQYVVYALGSQPGFGYLGGLPARLASPRRDVINPRVEAGSVIIGGAQTAVQSRTTPSGWHVIGKTELALFDPKAQPPNIFAPGDRVQFILKEVLS